MKILGNRLLLSKVEEEQKEGFKTVEIQDSFIYKGKVELVGEEAKGFSEGDIVLFAKYSPDTNDIELDGNKYKVVNVADIIAIL
jgi:co-chaperonin GroES (HSP10)